MTANVSDSLNTCLPDAPGQCGSWITPWYRHVVAQRAHCRLLSSRCTSVCRRKLCCQCTRDWTGSSLTVAQWQATFLLCWQCLAISSSFSCNGWLQTLSLMLRSMLLGQGEPGLIHVHVIRKEMRMIRCPKAGRSKPESTSPRHLPYSC